MSRARAVPGGRANGAAAAIGAAVFFLGLLFSPGSCFAATQVSGHLSSEGPLIIDPSTEPTEPTATTMSVYPAEQVTMFIQEMPVTKLVNDITLGDLARQSGCGQATYSIVVTESPEGAADENQHTPTSQWVATSVGPQVLPAEPGEVIWRIQPTIFQEGSGYSIAVRGVKGCSTATVRTWPHNKPQVNPGVKRCDAIERIKASRMWHETGESDGVICPPHTKEIPSNLNSSMPTGWLVVKLFNGLPIVKTTFGPFTGGPQCDAGQEKVWWRESPTNPGWHEHVCRWTQFPGLAGEKPTDGWYYAFGGNQLGGTMRDAYLELSGNHGAVATYFKPTLYFDTAESWRPLDLSEMFDERYSLGEDEIPRHAVCPEGIPEGEYTPECFGVIDPSELMAENNNVEEARLDVELFGMNAAIEEYLTPGCSTEVELWDCVGSDSAIYWRMTPEEATEAEPDAYRYVQYWMFYRVNSWSDAIPVPPPRHEGDWEAVAIAPSRDRPGAFDFASFSQHGQWYSYLRENLYCTTSKTESCGPDNDKYAGVNLKVFPANGSHANYATKCSEINEFLDCEQNGVGTPERGHDGAISWVHNGGPEGLLELPASKESWTFWKGEWGAEGGPRSPGYQGLFTKSWGGCADDDEGCPVPLIARSKAKASAARGAHQSTHPRMINGPYVKACERWFGADVAALLCEPKRLEVAVDGARLGVERGMSVDVIRQPETRGSRAAARAERSESVLGLSQVVGMPLKPGDDLDLSARPVARRWQLLLRVEMHEGRLLEARFPHVRFERAQVIRVRGVPALRLADGRVQLPSAVRRAGQ